MVADPVLEDVIDEFVGIDIVALPTRWVGNVKSKLLVVSQAYTVSVFVPSEITEPIAKFPTTFIIST